MNLLLDKLLNLLEMYKVGEQNGNNILETQSIHEKLDEIKGYLEKEIAFKQLIIDSHDSHVGQLKTLTNDKDKVIRRLEDQLQECKQTNEGTRQLINKLLNDISNYQKDIEWYKRTFEKRSLAGTIWQKLFRKPS